jgi:hypothetical protein
LRDAHQQSPQKLTKQNFYKKETELCVINRDSNQIQYIMLKKSLIAMLFFLFVGTGSLLAQDYNTGIGLRGGFSQGLTVKHFLNQNNALEGILHTRWRGWMITGLYEVHKNIPDAPGLRWYYGGGAHMGWWQRSDGNPPPWAKENKDYSVFGVDFILGIEYTIPKSPINIALDWKPAFNLVGYEGLWADGAAFSIRFVF